MVTVSKAKAKRLGIPESKRKSLTRKELKAYESRAPPKKREIISPPPIMAKTLPTIHLKPLTAWEKAQKTRETLPLPLKILTSLKTTAFLGATLGVLLAPATAGRLALGAVKKLPSVAKALIPKTLTGKFALGTAGYLAYESPKVREMIKGAPASYVSAVKTTAQIIEGEKELTPESFKDVAKTGGAVLGLGAIGLGIGLAGKKILEKIPKAKEKAEEVKEKVLETTPSEVKEVAPDEQLIIDKPVGIDGETPILPATTTITTGKKPYKRRRATKPSIVKQSVRVNVINRATATGIRNTHKYLNTEILMR